MSRRKLLPYRSSLAGTLLGAREAVMAPIRPFLKAAGVSEQQWRLLRVLADEPGIDNSTLAHLAMLHPSSVTRISRDVVDRGLVDRFPDEHDGRRSFFELTAKGRNLVEQTAERTLEILQNYEHRFGTVRLARLRADLMELSDVIHDLYGSFGEPEEDGKPVARMPDPVNGGRRRSRTPSDKV